MPRRVPPPGRIPFMAGLGDFPILFGISPRTADTWQRRDLLPPPDITVSGRCHAWVVSRLVVWAEMTGRDIYPDKLREHREHGRDAVPRKVSVDVEP